MSTKVATNGPSKHFRRGRAAGANLVPATTGAARATTRALPEHAGRFDGIAVRASIPVGSIADITFVTSRRTSVEEVDERFVDAAQTKRYPGVPGVSRDPLVSPDVVGDPRASIVDLELTKVSDGDLVKVMSWYARGTVGDQRALILQHGPAQRDSIVTGSSGTIGSPPPSSILGKTFDAACGKERVPYPENDPPLKYSSRTVAITMRSRQER